MDRSGEPEEQDLLLRAVADVARATGYPLVFGGFASAGTVTIDVLAGNRTRHLHGLRVRRGRGLGGRSMAENRPRVTDDYATSRLITHDYDDAVLGEGVSTLLAVPVIVTGRIRAVLYGGAHARSPAGDRLVRPALTVADALARELRIRDEVDRRLATLTGTLGALGRQEASLSPAVREELREGYCELRDIAAGVDDAGVRERLRRLERRLVRLASGTPEEPSDVRLSPRETDVLARAALGRTNAEIAGDLGLSQGTVKAYMRAAMTKLDASTRHAAVSAARRAGLLA